MKTALSIACLALAVAFVLAAPSVASAAPTPAHDVLAPLRNFVSTARAAEPLVARALSVDERAAMDRLRRERPDALPSPAGLDALRQAASRPAAPGGR